MCYECTEKFAGLPAQSRYYLGREFLKDNIKEISYTRYNGKDIVQICFPRHATIKNLARISGHMRKAGYYFDISQFTIPTFIAFYKKEN